MDGKKIKYPCQKYSNCKFNMPYDVIEHLYKHGFLKDYYQWTTHDELTESFVPPFNGDQISKGKSRDFYDQLNFEQRMIFDASGQNFIPPTRFNFHIDYIPPSMPENDFQEHVERESLQPPDEVNQEIDPPTTDVENRSSKQFLDALEAADEPLWLGCDKHTQLSYVARLMNLKSEYNLSENCFNGFLQLIGEGLPSDHKLPFNYYQTKKPMWDLGLPMEKIDICIEGCMLYWKDDAYAESCKFCGHDRYKRRGGQKPISHKVFRYLPSIPQLRRLYASEATARHMTWHADHEMKNGIMSHPSDGEAWK